MAGHARAGAVRPDRRLVGRGRRRLGRERQPDLPLDRRLAEIDTDPSAGALAIEGSGPDDVWFLGKTGGIAHWDGTVLTPKVAYLGSEGRSLWTDGPDRVWAGGFRGIHRYDGTDWVLQPMPESSTVLGLHGAGDRVFAVGHSGRFWTGIR